MTAAKPFQRTRSGKVARYKFFKRPIVWVEGDDDKVFFERALLDNCEIECADGRPECEYLIEEMVAGDLPYIVVVDGDYGILSKPTSSHKRVMLLERYAIENYLWCPKSLERICRLYVKNVDLNKSIEDGLKNVSRMLEVQLTNLISLDVLNIRKNGTIKSFPDNCGNFVDGESLTLKIDQIKAFEATLTGLYSESDVQAVKAEVVCFTGAKGITSLLRGHFAFGLLRMFLQSVLKPHGKKITIDGPALLALLSGEVWRPPVRGEHLSLRTKLRRSICATQKLLLTS